MPILHTAAPSRKSRLLGRSGIFLLSLLSTISVSAKEKPEEKARPLLDAALERSLLRTDSNSPFNLSAKFIVYGLGAKRQDGKYAWSMNSSGDWAKQVSFADYSDLQIGRGSTVWTKRSVAFQPLQAALVQNAFRIQQFLAQAGDTVDRYYTTTEHHVKMRCTDLLHGEKVWKQVRTICVDPQQNLRSIELGSSKIVYQYLDYKFVGGKSAPSKIIATRDGTTLLEVEIDRISVDSEVDSPMPEVPPGAIQRIGCIAPTLPILKRSVPPDYPLDALQLHPKGQVMLYVLIGSDGTVRNAVVTQTAGEALDSAVLNAVRQRQYEPAKCGTTPVEFEAEVPANFRLEIRVE